jgi:hypothetical protein
MDIIAVLLLFLFFCWQPERTWPLHEPTWP